MLGPCNNSVESVIWLRQKQNITKIVVKTFTCNIKIFSELSREYRSRRCICKVFIDADECQYNAFTELKTITSKYLPSKGCFTTKTWKSKLESYYIKITSGCDNKAEERKCEAYHHKVVKREPSRKTSVNTPISRPRLSNMNNQHTINNNNKTINYQSFTNSHKQPTEVYIHFIHQLTRLFSL